MTPPPGQIAAAWLRIDLAAVAENYRILLRQVAPARVGAVIKANAYGLGARAVGDALARAGCRDFFVAQLAEAMDVRTALPADARLYVLNGLPRGAERDCAALGAIPVLNSLDQADRWNAVAGDLGSRLPAALQVDSGMSRLGMPPAETDRLLGEPGRLGGVDLTLLMSHLACADDPDHPANGAQDAVFRRLAACFPGVSRSLHNSGGCFLPQSDHLELVRAGIALYGGGPHLARPNPMRPVASLAAGIIQLRDVPEGTRVGYGHSFTAGRRTRIATVGVGYADGWPRSLGNRGSAFIEGFRVPVVGRVSMDSMTLDVTDVPETALVPGAPVELLGPCQTIDDVAADADTIAYEILTRLGSRFSRDYDGVAA